MDFALYFLIGAAFGIIVWPAIRLWRIKSHEIEVLAKQGVDSAKKQAALDALIAHVHSLQPADVRMIAIVVQGYDETKNFCGFGGAVDDIAHGINIMVSQLANRAPGLEIGELRNKGD